MRGLADDDHLLFRSVGFKLVYVESNTHMQTYTHIIFIYMIL